MKESLVTTFFLPVALGIVMLGLGLSLTLADVKRITFPVAAAFGYLVGRGEVRGAAEAS